jgi:hypothetical protein
MTTSLEPRVMAARLKKILTESAPESARKFVYAIFDYKSEIDYACKVFLHRLSEDVHRMHLHDNVVVAIRKRVDGMVQLAIKPADVCNLHQGRMARGSHGLPKV